MSQNGAKAKPQGQAIFEDLITWGTNRAVAASKVKDKKAKAECLAEGIRLLTAAASVLKIADTFKWVQE